MSRIPHDSNNHHIDQELQHSNGVISTSASPDANIEDNSSVASNPSLVLTLKVDSNKLNEIMNSAPQPNGGPARAFPTYEPAEGTGKRKRKPTVKAVDQFESSDEDEEEEEEDEDDIGEDDEEEEGNGAGISAPASKGGKPPIITKPRGPRDIYIGRLSDFPEMRVHATKAASGARARVFFQDVPTGKLLQDYGVMSNGMVKIARVVLDDALLTEEVIAAAGLDPSDDLMDRTPMMALVKAYHKIATANVPESDHDDSNDEEIKDPKLRAARARDRVNRNRKRARKNKVVVEDLDEEEEAEFTGGDMDGGRKESGRRRSGKPTMLRAGHLKSDPKVEVYVSISTHTNRSPYVFYTPKDGKGRLKYRDIDFLSEFKKPNEDLAKAYFRERLTPGLKEEQVDSDADDEDTILMPATKKRKYNRKAPAAEPVQTIEEGDDSQPQTGTQKRKHTRRASKPVASDEAVDLELEAALAEDVPSAEEPVVAEEPVTAAKRKYKPRVPKVAVQDAALAEDGITPVAPASARSTRVRVSEPIVAEGGGVHGHGFAAPQSPANAPVVPKVAASRADMRTSQTMPVRDQAGLVEPTNLLAHLPDPAAAISAIQAYYQQVELRTQGLQTTIQNQTAEIEASRAAAEKQAFALTEANAKILALEQQIATLQLRPNPPPITTLPDYQISGRMYTRDAADSANPGLLRHEEDMEYDWGNKKWNRVITMRELDLVVDSNEDPVRYAIQDEDFQGSKLSDGSLVMVRCEGRFVNLGGHQYWERIVYQEAKSPRR